jgi:hypothetical protein
VLIPYSNDPFAKAQLAAFVQGLAELGWSEGRNLRMGVRWVASSVDRIGKLAKELGDLQPAAIQEHVGQLKVPLIF